MARPTKLTTEVADQIVQGVRDGLPLARAAEAAGVHRSTVYNWLQLAETAEATPDLVAFADRLTRARVTAQQTLINAAFQAAVGGQVIEEGTRPDGSTYVKRTPPDGRTALDLLARMDPEHWRPVKAVEVSGPGQTPIAVAAEVATIEHIIERIGEARQRRSEAEQRRSEAEQPRDDAEQIRRREAEQAFGGPEER
ncbi:helix-turn-helix domain-containing protein [Thermobispora bispora]|uniref:helix-turn-helix domain-containing protein n=1 Tax=Thermobispora bispora TaxID=2006 RepID=UPI0019804AE3|nr:helix-turn-helix domain-containing protein [Thermobispora bispora]QSI50008.1 hypothetical protein CYL17_18725 [Thermobispora bispora]